MTVDLESLLPKVVVVDLLLDPVVVVDEQGVFVFVSAACEKLLGYTPQELVGTRMIDLVHPEDRQRTLAAAERIMGGHSHVDFRNRYLGKDGSVVHIMWSAHWSEEDRVRIAVARDVSALERAERIQSALYRISEAAHSAADLAALYGEVHGIIGELLPAENFRVAMYDAAADELSYPYFVDARESGRAPQSLATAGPLADVIGSGRALLATRGRGPMSGGRGHGDWIGAPLWSRGGVIGALAARSRSVRVRYDEKDLELLQFVSTQVATAIERKRAADRLRHMAHHDTLTGLPNRALFHDRLDMALRRARRDGECVGVLYLDLDSFKAVNDARGHEVGDLLLREVAGRLVRCVRESDTVARMGGDEFTVLLTNVRDRDAAAGVAEKIRGMLAEPFTLEGSTLATTASIGTALSPHDGADREALIHSADMDMYAGKRAEAGVPRSSQS